MSKRDVNDKKIYQFASLGVGKWSHGEIVFDVEKNTTCPNCKKEYNFGRQKVVKIYPRYPKGNGQSCFYTEFELNTPSADKCGKGDKHPRISFIIKGCRLVLEDKVHDSRPAESANFRGSQLEIGINHMGETNEDNR